ncbi:MAG: serine hydrolase [Eudoraea sp.]|uniref:serine hydrolase domain-containing protein n=1 Tax=Eudoraea sp. TaxID=1979955 RepID=UPI003C75248A
MGRFLLFNYRFYILILFGILFSKSYAQDSYKEYSNSDSQLSKITSRSVPIDRISRETDHKVDSIITNGIKNHAFPGAQILVAKKGDIIFHKAYGFYTYDSIQPVALNAIYDLASVTKITGPLLALMKLYDEGKLDLDVPFSRYWKPWKHVKNKNELTLREILAHQAGLKPYIVFLNEVQKKGRISRKYIHSEPSPRFENQAYEHLYVKNRFITKMYKEIDRSQVSENKTYLYSGLAFLIFPKLISQLSGASYEYYLQKHFYLPMGATALGFKPKTKKYPNAIVPTEVDSVFRKDLVKGWVHDENAALMGGISGNAGLFGTARDLHIIMQMYQNYGIYDGQRYLSEATVKEFTKVQYPENDNRRGLGFDKPLLNNKNLSISEAYPAIDASMESFGHTGFTGTFIWADPINQLVFIFLSNRVYPTRDNRNLYELNIRPQLHQLFYADEGEK